MDQVCPHPVYSWLYWMTTLKCMNEMSYRKGQGETLVILKKKIQVLGKWHEHHQSPVKNKIHEVILKI